MNIAVDIRCLQDKVWTGVGEYTWNILESIGRLYPNINLKLLTIGWNNNLLAKAKDLGQVLATKASNRLINSLWSINSGPNWNEILLTKGYQPDYLWLPNLSFYKFNDNSKKILTVHDLSFIHFPQFFSWRKRIWYLHYVKNIILKRLQEFSLILTVSEATAVDLKELRPDLAARIVSVKPGLAQEFHHTPSSEQISFVKKSYGLDSDYILSVGTIEPRKNHLLLLKVFERLAPDHPELNLVISGPYGWKYQEFVSFWKQMKYKSRVKLLGYITRQEQLALYAGAKLFLYPSFYEGFGFPPLEAMSQSIPTIVSNVSSLPEIVRDGALVCDPWIVNEWIQTIKFLLADNNYRINLGNQGKIVANSYTWERAAHQTILAINNL